jgi:hypothetical protein
VDRSYGCDGELTSEDRERQAGGSISLLYEHTSGLKGQLEGSVAWARPSQKDGYWLGSIGTTVGMDRKGVGLDLGIAMIMKDCCNWMIVPRFALRFGSMDFAWFDLSLGKIRPPFDGRIVSAGFGLRKGWLRLDAGVAALGRAMRDPGDYEDDPQIGNLEGGDGFAGYLMATIMPSKHFGFNLGGLFSSEGGQSFQAGLTLAF